MSTLEERIQELERITGAITEALNDKTDRDVGNLDSTGKALVSGFGMPSNRYVDLTLGAEGTTYTAPANGYVIVSKNATGAGQFLTIIYKGVNWTRAIAHSSGQQLSVYAPVKKGDTFKLGYNVSGSTEYFRFYYAEGEE